MRYEIMLSPEAVQDLKRLSAHDRAEIRDMVETHLRHKPLKISKSRIKRLQGLSRPQFRLRSGEYRVYYDVVASRVQVLAIINKAASDEWLKKAGELK
jgi:mRNA interferase RelE/StbE